MTRSLKRPYTGSKAVSGSCRGRDGCPVCVGNRTAKHARQVVDSVAALVASHGHDAILDACDAYADDDDYEPWCWCCEVLVERCRGLTLPPVPPFRISDTIATPIAASRSR